MMPGPADPSGPTGPSASGSTPPGLSKLARELRSIEPGEEFDLGVSTLHAMETDQRDGATYIEARKHVDDAPVTVEIDDATDVIVIHSGDTKELIG